MKPVASSAAILIGNRGAEKSCLASRQPDGPRHNLVLLPLRVVRRDLTLDEAAHLIAIKLVLFGKQRTGKHRLILTLACVPVFSKRDQSQKRVPGCMARHVRRGSSCIGYG